MLKRTSLNDGWLLAEKSWQDGAKLGFSVLEWIPASVPGHVHVDLVRAGVIGHPFAGRQELGCQWVDETDFGYKLRFEWQPDGERPQRVLRFEGLDTVCSIHLNGRKLAEHDNMFVPLEVDVSSSLQPGENELRVEFVSAARVGRERRRQYVEQERLPNDVERFNERSFVRKAQYMYGWDWGPRLVSAGIWRPVTLLEFAARIVDVHVTQLHRSDGSVQVSASSVCAGEGTLVHCLDEQTIKAGDGTLADLALPALWFPSGMGEQRLSTLESYLCPSGFDPAALPGDVAEARRILERVALDKRVVRFGLRRVRLVREPDRFGESFEFEINGRRLWAMGANWIPDHSFPSTVTRDTLRAKLERARALGMNMLRVWGGGLYETDEFYELCDELGILVWQDFPFACAYYPDEGPWADVVAHEAAVNVRRLRNHACLALWCGNNENLTMFEQGWGGRHLHPPRCYGERLYDAVLPRVVEELDPSTPYIPTSPWGGEKDCNQGGIGDQHYWDVWHGRGDWRYYRDSTARFCSEYGFAAACSPFTWRTVVGLSTDADVRDAVARWHDKTLKGYETFLGFVALHYPAPETLDDWIYYSQLNQRDAIRCAVEHYRRSEFCKGSLIWQLNDCWPVQSWALMDSESQPKAAWFELARLYAPALIGISVEDGEARVWAALDNGPADATLAGALTLTAYQLGTGAVSARFGADVRLAVGERRDVLRASLADLPPRQTLLVARLGTLSATALLAEPKELELGAPAPLAIELSEGRLRLTTPTPLVDLVLLDGGRSDAFADNAVTYPVPGSYSIAFTGSGSELELRSLAGRHPLRVTGGH